MHFDAPVATAAVALQIKASAATRFLTTLPEQSWTAYQLTVFFGVCSQLARVLRPAIRRINATARAKQVARVHLDEFRSLLVDPPCGLRWEQLALC
jgi:hypothetical protein